MLTARLARNLNSTSVEEMGGNKWGQKMKTTGHCGDRSHDLEEYRILRTTRSTTEPNAQMTQSERISCKYAGHR